MVSKKLGAKSGKDLDGASICVSAGTTSELNLADYFRSNGLKFTAITGATREQNQQNLDAGRCDAYSNERGGLAASRTAMKPLTIGRSCPIRSPKSRWARRCGRMTSASATSWPGR